MKVGYVETISKEGKIRIRAEIRELLGFINGATVYFWLVKSVYYHRGGEEDIELELVVSSIAPAAWAKIV